MIVAVTRDRQHGSLLLAVPIAALAGLVSFLSPCVLPLVPGYLSYVTGLTGADLADAPGRRGRLRARRGCCSSLGFTVGVRARRRAVRRPRRPAARTTPTASRACSASSRSCSGWRSSASCPGCSASAAPPRARRSGSPARRCSACCSASAGRRASARRSAPCWRSRSTRAAPPRGARPRGRLLRSGSACRSCWPALAYRRALGAFALGAARTTRSVMRLGGGDARRRRRAAGHRRSGSDLDRRACRSGSAASSRRSDDDVDQTLTGTGDGTTRRRRGRRLGAARLAALGLAAAHLDADRAAPAVPARAGVRPGLAAARSAASTRRGSRSTSSEHPTLGRWLDRLSLFDVYASPWFARDLPAAVRLARRLRRPAQPCAPAKAMRARPPRGAAQPRRGCRSHATYDDRRSRRPRCSPRAGGAARPALPGRRRRRRLRCRRRRATCARPATWSSTSSLLLLLVAVGARQPVRLPRQRARRRRAAASPTRVTAVRHASTPGAASTRRRWRRSPSRSTTSRCATRSSGAAARRAARLRRARSRYSDSPDAEPHERTIRVNHPLKVDGTKVFLLGNGYAPRVHGARRRGRGRLQRTGAVPAAGRQHHLDRRGQGARTRSPSSSASSGVFLPTAVARPEAGPISVFPDAAAAAGRPDRVHRRPRPRRRAAAVGLPARHRPDDAARAGRQAAGERAAPARR